MEELIKWLHRYQGCKMAWTRLDIYSETEISAFNIHLITIGNYKEVQIQLVLKELKDIREEDLEELNDIHKCDYNKEKLSDHEYTFLTLEVDFLRSKGYAIGIPKDYYITAITPKH